MRVKMDEYENSYEIEITIGQYDPVLFSRRVKLFMDNINPLGGSMISEISSKSTGKCRAVISAVPLPYDFVVVDDEREEQTVFEFISSEFPDACGLSYEVTCE